MSDYSRHISWLARCTDRGAYGITAGDSLHCGFHDYNQLHPCPNGLPIDTRQPQDVQPWRDRVEKAKRDIENWNTEILMESVEWTDEDLKELLRIGAVADG